MRSSLSVFLGAVTIAACAVLGSAERSQATDWCFNAAGITLVAQNFVKPAKGACKPFTGHKVSGEIVSGTACTTSNGDTLRIGYVIHPQGPSGQAEIGQIDIPLPALTGGATTFRGINFDKTTYGTSGPGNAVPCVPANQPVP